MLALLFIDEGSWNPIHMRAHRCFWNSGNRVKLEAEERHTCFTSAASFYMRMMRKNPLE